MPYQKKHSNLVLFDQVVNEEDFLEFLIEWSDSIVPPTNVPPCNMVRRQETDTTFLH